MQRARNNASSNSRHLSVAAAVMTIAASYLLWFPRVGGWLTSMSYDLPIALGVAFAKPEPPPDLIMAYLDETTYQTLRQSPKTFDRREHARVLRYLHQDGVRMVVYDVWFAGPRTQEEDEALADALRECGNAVIAITLDDSSQSALLGTTERLPLPIFAEATAAMGVTQVGHPHSVVRRYLPGTETYPSLPWAAARVAGLDRAQAPQREPVEPWIHYYGPPRYFRSLHFSDVTEQTNGFFRDKVVFIGTFPSTPDALEETDEFEVPVSRFGGALSPGVDIWAHAYLNVMRGDGWRRWSWTGEWLALACSGLLLGLGLSRMPFRRAWIAAAAVAAGAGIVGVALPWWRGEWFSWTLISGVQAPVSLAWVYWTQFSRITKEKEHLEEQLASQVGTSPLSKAGSRRRREEDSPTPSRSPRITDHTLIRRVGRGAYGEVWLARNVIGLYHAVKVVYRDAFAGEGPYEREFHGIERFMPVSRSHSALVHVLHVGRDEQEGWFYYVMEAADDLETGSDIEPESYFPKSLSAMLRRQGTLDPRTCVHWMRDLAGGLSHLHQHQLIHRDIKPANIIVVHGRPKLADIGLVTKIATTKESVSLVGTEGYMAPEGPGTPSADLYGLGKVFYQACTGQDPELFPELPTGFPQRSDQKLLQALNRILGSVCDNDPDHRPRSAEFLVEALERLLGE